MLVTCVHNQESDFRLPALSRDEILFSIEKAGLDLLLLKILALEPLHGWAIHICLRQISPDVLRVTEGCLYPALHKLEQEDWINAEWKETENGSMRERMPYSERICLSTQGVIFLCAQPRVKAWYPELEKQPGKWIAVVYTGGYRCDRTLAREYARGDFNKKAA